MTTNAAEFEPIELAGVEGDPSPQSMVAVKSVGIAAELSSVNVATASLNAVPSATVKSTGKAVMTVARAGDPTQRPTPAATRKPSATAETGAFRTLMRASLREQRAWYRKPQR